MGGRLAILACAGQLPIQIATACPQAMIVTLAGVPSDLEDRSHRHRLEQIGALFEDMRANGVDRIVFAGALARPRIDPAAFDAKMMAIAPHLMAAMPKGDDALLRTVIEIFENERFSVVGAHDLLPDLVAQEGLLAGVQPGAADVTDADRGIEILQGMSQLDIGQGCVVAAGQCLGVETVQGTDALLRFAADTPEALKRGQSGVYVKAAKQGQDLQIDMPTIGPSTVAAVAAAGLGGMVIEAGRVMILDRAATLATAEDHGLYLVAKAM